MESKEFEFEIVNPVVGRRSYEKQKSIPVNYFCHFNMQTLLDKVDKEVPFIKERQVKYKIEIVRWSWSADEEMNSQIVIQYKTQLNGKEVTKYLDSESF